MSHFPSLVRWIVRLPAFWVPLQTLLSWVLMSVFVGNVCFFTSFLNRCPYQDVSFTSSQQAAEGLNMSFAHDQNDLHIGVGILCKKKTLSSSDGGKGWLKGIWIVVLSATTEHIILSDGGDCCDPLLTIGDVNVLDGRKKNSSVCTWLRTNATGANPKRQNKEIRFCVTCTVPTVININQIQLTQLKLIVYHVITLNLDPYMRKESRLGSQSALIHVLEFSPKLPSGERRVGWASCVFRCMCTST